MEPNRSHPTVRPQKEDQEGRCSTTFDDANNSGIFSDHYATCRHGYHHPSWAHAEGDACDDECCSC